MLSKRFFLGSIMVLHDESVEINHKVGFGVGVKSY